MSAILDHESGTSVVYVPPTGLMPRVYLREEIINKPMFDHHILYELSKAEHAERLRAAAADRRAQEVPPQPSVLRATISRWLHALANHIEPSTTPLAGIEPASAHAR